MDDRKILKCQEHTISLYGSPYYHSTLIYLCIYYCDDSVLYSEDEPQETFPASRVISSQILGYDGGEVDSKDKVEVLFPVHVSLSFICNYITDVNRWQTALSQCHNVVMELWIHALP